MAGGGISVLSILFVLVANFSFLEDINKHNIPHSLEVLYLALWEDRDEIKAVCNLSIL